MNCVKGKEYKVCIANNILLDFLENIKEYTTLIPQISSKFESNGTMYWCINFVATREEVKENDK